MDIIDLRKREDFINQYVQLRNAYAELLLTSPVNVSETREWLQKNDIEIRSLVENDVLLGVVILYLNKEGEISFFAKDLNKGIGSRLLNIVEEVAKKKNLKSIWAWVLEENLIAQKAFERGGFKKESVSEKEYKGIVRKGIQYKKYLSY
jgi:N-acetylglutamate synthase-like GNAT family acetyltransferase